MQTNAVQYISRDSIVAYHERSLAMKSSVRLTAFLALFACTAVDSGAATWSAVKRLHG